MVRRYVLHRTGIVLNLPNKSDFTLLATQKSDLRGVDWPHIR